MTDTQVRSRRRWPWLVGGVALVLAAAIVLTVLVARRNDGGVGQLARRDPHGTLACQALRDWAAGKLKDPLTGQPYDRSFAARTIPDQADQASTAAIRAASGDLDQLRTACIAAGVSVPALPSS